MRRDHLKYLNLISTSRYCINISETFTTSMASEYINVEHQRHRYGQPPGR